MNIQEQEHRDFHYATDGEWDSAAAREIGAGDPTRAWVLTDRDVWHRNPFYQGPAVRHPEDDSDDAEAVLAEAAPFFCDVPF